MNYTGIEEIAAASERILGDDESHHFSIMLDTSTNEVWYDEFIGNNWVEYNDPDILKCGIIRFPATADDIEEMIELALAMRE